MDSLQQSHRFMRPPPPPPATPSPPPHMADPQQQHHHHHLQHHQQQQQQPPGPPPPQGNWFSSQFQFHASQPPPPPPPPHQQPMWVPHSDHQLIPPTGSYPPSQPNTVPPYPSHPQPHNPYLPPPPNRYSHPPQAYPQTWENPNQIQQQSWEHPDRSTFRNNEEDWAARAREWAAAKAATENQHAQMQFAPVGRPEEHNHVYHDHLRQPIDPRYTEPQQPPHPSSSQQHFAVSPATSNGPAVNHLQESTFNFGASSSYVSDGRLPYMARDEGLTRDQNPVFPQGSTPANSSIYQQEVPSSYSTVPGTEASGDLNEQLRRPSHLEMQEGPHYMQPNFSTHGRSASLEQPHFAYGDRSAERVAPCDRPLEFTPTFSREHDPHPQPSYSHTEPTPPVGPGVVYPPIPPVPSGLQFDPSFGPPVPGHAASMFGQIPGPNFPPGIPGASAQYGLGAGIPLHPTTPFPGDVNAGSNVSDRPKKASVPNWLREEIIKKKAAMASSSQECPEGDPSNPIEEDYIDKSFTNAGQPDNKSIDSSRLSDDDDDDEDDVEAARTAAINQEIKRVLTEVLLKVTDELFDEIATKVLNEDDVTVEVDHSISEQKHASPPVPATKASAKVLIPVKAKETETADDVSEKSSSGAPGDILGLASYASDNDDDEVTESSSIPTTKQIHNGQQSTELSEKRPGMVENGSSRPIPERPSEAEICKENEHKRTGPSRVDRDDIASDNGRDEKLNLENNNLRASVDGTSGTREDKINIDGGQVSVAKVGLESMDAVVENIYMKPELPHGNVNSRKQAVDDSQRKASRSKSDHGDEKDKKRNSFDRDFVKEAETVKLRTGEKYSDFDDKKRQDQRYSRKEKTDDRDRDVLKDRVRDRGTRTGEKANEDSRRDSNSKEDKKETEKLKKTSAKKDTNKKRERSKDEKGDRSRDSRHRAERDPSRHKRRRSSSISSRGRDSKDNSVGGRADESSDGASENSRKPRPKKRSLSPSPTRSRRRRVSRSPHIKHSRRRHSPYPSLEGLRRRRSRSNSPVHRRRR